MRLLADARRALSDPGGACTGGLDVGLPDETGFDSTAKSAADPSEQSAGIMLTGAQRGDRLRGGLELGADDYVVKPFSSREVSLRVRNAASGVG